MTTKKKNKPKVSLYHGNECVSKYWIWNKEHNCIAWSKIEGSKDKKIERFQS